jgi:hypothetical protein
MEAALIVGLDEEPAVGIELLRGVNFLNIRRIT